MVKSEESSRIIITVLGHDRVGIIAGIATILAEAGINILDISQTILQGFFTMVMVADMSGSSLILPGCGSCSTKGPGDGAADNRSTRRHI